MFILQKNEGGDWKDKSCHTLSIDADTQKSRFEAAGVLSTDLRIVEKETFSPEQEL